MLPMASWNTIVTIPPPLFSALVTIAWSVARLNVLSGIAAVLTAQMSAGGLESACRLLPVLDRPDARRADE